MLVILPCPYAIIRDNHTGLVSAILPCPCAEIRVNHTGLDSAILHCPCAEIRVNHTCLVSAILPCSYVEIWDNHMCLVSAILPCSFFFWSLCCMSYFDLWVWVAPLISSFFSSNFQLKISRTLDEVSHIGCQNTIPNYHVCLDVLYLTDKSIWHADIFKCDRNRS